MNELQFQFSVLLWLLLLLPAAMLAFFWWTWRKRERLLGAFIDPRLLGQLMAGVSKPRRKFKLALLVAAVAWLVVTLARPQWGFDWEESKQRGLEVVIAVDTSKSMLADDIAPDRLTRAKLAALDLMQLSHSDRLGLVAFAGSAFLMCPLTIDDGAFRQCVDALDVDTIPQGGTALAEAIETALTAFKSEADAHKVLVLFSDGEDHDERAVAAAETAARAGMRIFTVGIGTAEGEMLRLKDAKGRTDYVRDDDGNVVKSRLNESLLQQIAKAGNGFYLPLRGARTMDTLYEQGLAPLPKSESQARLVKRFHEQFHWPLALAMLLLVAEFLLPERRRTPRVAGVGAAVLLALAVLTPGAAQASVSSAQRAYGAGRYEQALKDYEALLQRKADDPRIQFNAGAAAYRDGQFEAARERFTKAVTAPDLKLQQHAYYNRGNALYQVGDRETDLDKKREPWERAAKDYEAALQLDQADADARHNLELVKRKLEELKQQQQQQNQPPLEPSEEAKKAKAAADAAVDQRRYQEALEIMETQLRKDSTTQYYSSFIKRLQEVTNVQDSNNARAH